MYDYFKAPSGVYIGEKETAMVEGIEVPGFEIFNDVFDFGEMTCKGAMEVKEVQETKEEALPTDDILGYMSKLLLGEDEVKAKPVDKTDEMKPAIQEGVEGAADKTPVAAPAVEDMAALIFSSVVEVDDYPELDENFCTSIFEEDDAFLFEMNAMNNDFAYLFDVDHDGTVHTLDHLTSMFSIHSIDTSEINIGIREDDPRLVSVSSKVTPQNSERFRKNIDKAQRSFCRRL